MSSEKLEIHDASSLRKYRTETPNIIFEIGLSPYELALYLHLKRSAGAGKGGVCWKSTSTLATETGMSTGMISKAKKGLQKPRETLNGKTLINFTDRKSGVQDRITISDIWEENFAYFRRSNLSPGESNLSPGERKKEPIKKEHNEEDTRTACGGVCDASASAPPSAASTPDTTGTLPFPNESRPSKPNAPQGAASSETSGAAAKREAAAAKAPKTSAPKVPSRVAPAALDPPPDNDAELVLCSIAGITNLARPRAADRERWPDALDTVRRLGASRDDLLAFRDWWFQMPTATGAKKQSLWLSNISTHLPQFLQQRRIAIQSEVNHNNNSTNLAAPRRTGLREQRHAGRQRIREIYAERFGGKVGDGRH